MKVAEYIVKRLLDKGVKDAFGIPGGVILRLMYTMQEQEDFSIHLNYHEQMAGFAACGYAWATNGLGVAYATRGPGISNMFTCIAEAYQESLPVIFFTAHGFRKHKNMRSQNIQELNIAEAVTGITKYAANVDNLEEVVSSLEMAFSCATEGRKGPVLLDFSSSLFNMEIDVENISKNNKLTAMEQSEEAIENIKSALSKSKRPIILIGDGLRSSTTNADISGLADKIKIPILSSRASKDLINTSDYYFGYVGSHGIRYSNFILSKADLIIVVGNQLSFPKESQSFKPILDNVKIIRLDIDSEAFNRKIEGAQDFNVDTGVLIKNINKENIKSYDHVEWLNICNELKNKLYNYDVTEPVLKLESFIKKIGDNKTFVCDVGNHEFWFCRAYEKVKIKGKVYHSKAFGTLGTALGRAIGVYYATKQEVICIIGDQGLQYNIQELQYMVQWKLPIKIVLVNNKASRMIADHEREIFGDRLVHVDADSEYSVPDFAKIATAYGIKYTQDEDIAVDDKNKQILYEIICDTSISLTPSLPKGNACQDMYPLLDREEYNYCDKL